MAEPETFKQRFRDIQELVRELFVLRRHNLKFKEGDSQATLLLFSEGALAIIILERFVRAVLGASATDRDTLGPLLQKATGGPDPLLVLPWDDQEDGRQKLCNIRNTILHGNFEQAARQAGVGSVAEYFKKQFAGEVEAMVRVVDDLFKQIDPQTGERVGARSKPNG